MDEKGFLISQINRIKRVFNLDMRKRGKLISAGQDGNRSWITLLVGICQDRTTLPPFVIYQGQKGHIQDSWLDDFDLDK